MARKTISLPDEMEAYVEDRVKSGQYGNDSEYIRDLIRKDQKEMNTIARFQKLIDEGMASGISNKTLDEIFEAAKKRAASRKKK
jgi:antitoxin ParD1/3/4